MVELGPPTRLHLKGKLVTGSSATIEDDVINYNAGAGGPVAVVKIIEPITPMLNYYEFKILERGDKCCIAVGAGSLSYPQGQQPGWTRDGIGYHADDGNLYHQRGFGSNLGPTCTTGDRMGCGIDFDSESGNDVRVFFTKNGVQVGDSQKMKRPIHGLYPLFGLHSRGERIKYLGHWHVSPENLRELMTLEHSPSTYWIRSNGVRFLDHGLTLEYAGEGGNIQDCAVAQANFPMSVSNHYFELRIIDGGAGCSIAIGLGKLTYPLHRHPGWNPGAIGYHADDGMLFHERGVGRNYGPTCAAGDVMGCGIRFGDVSEVEELEDNSSESDTSLPEESLRSHNPFNPHHILDFDESDSDDDLGFGGGGGLFGRFRFGGFHPRPNVVVAKPKPKKPIKKRRKVTVYFTKNGEHLEDVKCELPSGGFYPLVAMLSRGEKVRVDLHPLSG